MAVTPPAAGLEGKRPFSVRHICAFLGSTQARPTCAYIGVSFIAFVSDVQKRLPVDKDDSTAATVLLRQVQKQAKTVEKYGEKAHHDMLGDEELEREGTNLWNLCTRLSRDYVGKPDKPDKPSASWKLVHWGRLLSFQILHLCHWSSKSTSSVACHLLRLALKVAKICIGLWLLHLLLVRGIPSLILSLLLR